MKWGDFLHFSLLKVVRTPPPSEKNVRAHPQTQDENKKKHAIFFCGRNASPYIRSNMKIAVKFTSI